MRVVREHPGLMVLTIVSASAVSFVAAENDWSELGLYAAMTGLIFVLALLTALLEVRRRGPELFRERERSSQENPPRG